MQVRIMFWREGVFVDLGANKPIVRLLLTCSHYVLRVPYHSRQLTKSRVMIYTLVGIVAALLFVYLLVALLKPELFP